LAAGLKVAIDLFRVQLLAAFSGHAAQASTHFTATWLAADTGEATFAQGTYTDTLVQDAGRWQFMMRQIDIGFLAGLPQASERFTSLGWPPTATGAT
jgi:predicted lipoprotein